MLKTFLPLIFANKKTAMANMTYQSDKLWVTVSLSEKTAFVRGRNSILDEWSDWKKLDLEAESNIFFDSIEKDLRDYLAMFDDKPFGYE